MIIRTLFTIFVLDSRYFFTFKYFITIIDISHCVRSVLRSCEYVKILFLHGKSSVVSGRSKLSFGLYFLVAYFGFLIDFGWVGNKNGRV